MARQFTAIELAATDPLARSALNAYLDYQTARSIRRMLMTRLLFFVLGFGIVTLGLHWLPVAALVVTSVLASGLVAMATAHELKARRHLRELNSPGR